MAFLERQVLSLEIAQGFLHRHVLDLPEYRLGLLHRLVVSGEQDDGDPEASRQVAIQPVLAHGAAVDPHVFESGDPRVTQDPIRRSSLGVVADKERGIEAVREALELAEHPLHSGPEPSPLVEILGSDVTHVAVGIGDHDVCRATVDRALDGCVDVAGHDLAEGLVSGHAAEDFFDLLYAGNALHVDRDKDPHGSSLLYSDLHSWLSDTEGARGLAAHREAKASLRGERGQAPSHELAQLPKQIIADFRHRALPIYPTKNRPRPLSFVESGGI